MKRVIATIELIIPDDKCPYEALEEHIQNIFEQGESIIDYFDIEVEDVEH